MSYWKDCCHGFVGKCLSRTNLSERLTTGTILDFVNSNDAARLAELGTSCPDHFLRTKIKPLFINWDPSGDDALAKLKELLLAGLEKYRADYQQYYESCKHPNSPAMRDPNPTVILIPGIGMIAWGKNKVNRA